MEPIKVLVVDDEPNIRDLLASGLRFAGFSVLAVSNGNDAVTAAEKGNPDLILLDVMLPDMSGFSVTKKLRSMNILAPVLLTDCPKIAASVAVGGGAVILSGFTESRRHDVQHAYEAQGLHLVNSLEVDGWFALEMQRP